ncbi:tRNA(Ile)-lysidine synthase [Natranaerovirga hydrolytica]|uniref:tRNA(Ile)-lysidine synthase n=1 Tax=Natranaerovirga hydrolytica TaxID=680378 RepID=A0A4R1M6I5_9FIRM|nr:tRNA lysidine(34) synthetase TilS [Natranaerovirga hydrolytica]TCK87856.1 tRNA(Ile)-lysidine synthase [Natranaerovirga hydrolytica]
MKDKILQYIIEEKMINKEDHIVVGVSGGADSICLLHILYALKDTLNITLSAVHINHGLRKEAAIEDAAFVKALCQKFEIPCYDYYYNIKEVAKKEKVSEEEAGRIIRYNRFLKVCNEKINGKIAVGHHMDDNAETILLNLIRGTGIKGLTGIQPIRGKIIRPLLNTSRKEIMDYLSKYNIAYREDLSNYQAIYTRNKVRLNVIPYIEKNINPNFVKKIVKTANILQEDNDFIQEYAYEKYTIIKKEEANNSIKLYLEGFLKEHIAIRKRVVQLAIKHISTEKNIEAAHINQIIQLAHKEVSKQINLPNSIVVKKNYSTLDFFIDENNSMNKMAIEYGIKIPSKVHIMEGNKTIITKILKNEKDITMTKKPYTKCFDYDKIENTLCVRTRKSGDFIKLKGLNGRKKLKDFFIDEKIPKETRDQILLIADEKNILWIIGYRSSDEYKVTKQTKNILMIEILGMEDITDGKN